MIRKKIFESFAVSNEMLLTQGTVSETGDKASGKTNIFSYTDPFDFYRKAEKSDRYVPVTQRGLRKAFERGLSGIEFYIEMATSLRPLADEAQNIDEITRLLSQQKLTTNPNLHSVTILRNLIKSPNPEIALYAAEGLNSIESTFIEKIQRVKDRIKDFDDIPKNKQEDIKISEDSTDNNGNEDKHEKSKKTTKKFVLHYLLGLLYLEFARLLHGQHLIQKFYINEAISCLKEADVIKRNNKRILTRLGECFMLIGQNIAAIEIFTNLFSINNRDRLLLMKLAECYYNIRDYDNVLILAQLASKTGMELDEISNLIIYQWLLNT